MAATGATVTDARRRAAGAVLVLLGAGVAAAALAAAPAGRTVELAVSRAGFKPARVELRRGETVRLVVASADAEHCFAVDGLRVEKRVTPARPARLELTPDRAGTFAVHCCLESGAQAERERGELVVVE